MHDKFETAEAAEVEDQTRAQMLAASPNPAARALGEALGATGPHLPPASLASACFNRLHRARAVTTVLPRVMDRERGFITVIPPRWFVPVDRLDDVEPRVLLNSFKQQVVRAGGRADDGCLFVRLEASLEQHPVSGELGWQLHLHGVATGSLQAAVRRLAATRAYAERDLVRQPVRCKRLSDERTARVLGYSTKGFWRTGVNDLVTVQGGVVRLSPRNRLPEPFHTQALLWLHRWTPGDLSLTMGTRAVRHAMRAAWD